MRRLTKLRTLMSIAFVVSVLFVGISGKLVNGVAKKNEMTFSTVKSIVLMGEPIVIETKITNTSGELKSPPLHRSDYQGLYSYAIESEKGVEIVLDLGAIEHWYSEEDFIHIEDGGVYTFREVISRLNKSIPWPEPGQYTIKRQPGGFPTTIFTVSAPEGRNAEAYDILLKIYTDSDHNNREALRLQLMDEYPETVYGQWELFNNTTKQSQDKLEQTLIKQALADDDPETADGMKSIEKMETATALARASIEEKLRYLIEKCPDFPQIDICKVRLSRLEPDNESRRAQLVDIMKAYPDSPAFFMVRDDIKELDAK